jgi:predicted glycoside hydrolase/deacetylase ChbG (UPF0249 family)
MTGEPGERYVVFNADDFGCTSGINRGVIEAHRRGVVTSTSLMVTGRAREEAVELVDTHPGLSVGLHWDAGPENERRLDLTDVAVVRRDFDGQLELFRKLLGRDPTHVDSHYHAHLDKALMPVFRDLVEPLDVPLRASGQVKFVGTFFAGRGLDRVGIRWLQTLLREEVDGGWTEIGCHPGYREPDPPDYSSEREEELRTLSDPQIRETIEELGLQLVGYADYPRRRS